MGRPNTALMISQSERSQLRSFVRSLSRPHSLARRAQILLLSADHAPNREAARSCGVSAPVVSLWRQRNQQRGIAGLARGTSSGLYGSWDRRVKTEIPAQISQGAGTMTPRTVDASWPSWRSRPTLKICESAFLANTGDSNDRGAT